LQRATNEQPTTKLCIEGNGRAVGEWAFAPGKTSIDMLPDWLTGSAKTSGDVA